MLTALLREQGHEVLSFVENQHGEMEGHGAEKPIDFEQWVTTDQAQSSFEYDTKGATESDLVIYISPSGTDAWAEVGAAWASGVPVFGLYAKEEPAGLMRKMMDNWHTNFESLLSGVDSLAFIVDYHA